MAPAKFTCLPQQGGGVSGQSPSAGAPGAVLELAEYAGERADEGRVTKGELEEYVLSWIAGPGMRISTSEIVGRMIGSGMLVKGGTLGRETQYLPAENCREIAERSPPWQPGNV